MVMTDATEREFPAPAFEFSAGSLCLDYVNTLGDRPIRDNDRLAGYGDLLLWGSQAGILGRATLRRLERRAGRAPRDAAAAFHGAIEIRETVYRIFSAVASGEAPDDGDLAILNGSLAEALPHLRLQGDTAGARWVWSGPHTDLDRVLWPVVRSAADLLTSPDAALVRECASDRCSWLFVDGSRNKRRRWCDMKTCGNRAKARRYYAKKRKGR
jgi:predicted RNA-binding Zn ribbon-like protein